MVINTSKSKALLLALLATPSVIVPVIAQGVTFTDVSELLGPFSNAPSDYFDLRGTGNEGFNGMTWFDYDDDGDVDLFICTGDSANNGLFRNNGDGTFTDVTEAAGLSSTTGHGGAVPGDIDNDGFVDLFLTGQSRIVGNRINQAPASMYRNNGDGTFTDITSTAGVPGPLTMFGATMGDYDNDGFLDIFITAPGSVVYYESHNNTLYRNNGNLTFTDVTNTAGVGGLFENEFGEMQSTGPCSCTFTDYDNDGLQDILIGSCNRFVSPNSTDAFAGFPDSSIFTLYQNNGDGTFTDVAEEAGLTDRGAWMGLAVGDIDNDGDFDIFATSTGAELGFGAGTPHVLYINNGDGTFTNKADSSGIPLQEWGWSNVFVDLDNDGALDVFFAGAGGAGFTNANRGTLAFNDGTGKFNEAATCGPDTCAGDCTANYECFQTETCALRDLTTGLWSAPSETCNAISGTGCDACYRASSCSLGLTPCEPATGVFLSSSVSCGVAHGDFDGDGFDEIAIMTVDYSADREGGLSPGAITNVVLLKNSGNSNNYLTVRPVGTTSNRGGIGAVLIANDGVNTQYREVSSGNSPHSDSQLWPSFGLGERESADITIRWPSGLEETFTDVQANMITELTEGTAPEIPVATGDASILGGTWHLSTFLVVLWSLHLMFV